MKLRSMARVRWLVTPGALSLLLVCLAAGCAQGTPPEPTTRDAGRDAPSPATPDAYMPPSVDAYVPPTTDAGATCMPACGDTEECCGTGCVNTDTNPNHCGRCGNRCPMGMLCSGGTCGGATCMPACDTGETCMGGTCRCGAGAACTGANTCCGSGCVDTQTNAMHCGGCDRPCGTDERCTAGRCVSSLPCGGSCPSGQMCCGGTCTRVDTVANCGACGRTCGAAQECCGGSTCVNTQTDRNNCGGCGDACGMRGDGCMGGSCTCGGGPGCIAACLVGMCFPA